MKKGENPVPPKTLFSPRLPATVKPQQLIHAYDATVLYFLQVE